MSSFFSSLNTNIFNLFNNNYDDINYIAIITTDGTEYEFNIDIEGVLERYQKAHHFIKHLVFFSNDGGSLSVWDLDGMTCFASSNKKLEERIEIDLLKIDNDNFTQFTARDIKDILIGRRSN